MYKKNGNKNICRQCYKKSEPNLNSKCQNCGSICCNLCKPDNIKRTVIFVYEFKQDRNYQIYYVCTKQCFDNIYNNSMYFERACWKLYDIIPSFNKGDWKEKWQKNKYIVKQLLTYLLKDICNIIIEYQN